MVDQDRVARWRGLLGGFVPLSILGVCLIGYNAPSVFLSLAAAPPADGALRGVLTPIVFTNEYGSRTAGDSWYPSFADSVLVEPHRLTTLSTAAATTAPGRPSRAAWSVSTSGALGPAVELVDGAWTVIFDAVGRYVVDVALPYGDCDANLAEAAASVAVACVYVRRSLRKLNPADRELYFDAFKTLMAVPTARGRRLYGGGYASLDDFVAVHLELAGDRPRGTQIFNPSDRGNDALHDGMGFVASHNALTLAFEAALQVVAPAASVPYWDYTEDHHLANEAEDRLATLWSLDVWGDDFFGTASGKYRTVETGRFAYAPIAKARAGQVHHELTFAVDSLYEWVWAAAYAPHGPVHFMIGGYTHCGDMAMAALHGNSSSDDLEASNVAKILGSVKQRTVAFPKTMWRYGLVEYPQACSDDTPQALCHMICDDPVSLGSFRKFALTGDMGENLFGAWVARLPVDLWGQFLELICTTPFTPGEQMGANSPVDPSFWPIHPTLDRLLQYKRIVKPFSSPGWEAPDGPTKYCITDYDGIGASDCKGHHPWDLHAMGDPRAYALPYVYDDFTWPHCDAEGHVFPPPSGAPTPGADAAAHKHAAPEERDPDDRGPPGHDDDHGEKPQEMGSSRPGRR
ncbi:hypothetical protein JL722_14354 [Aureococcus anophagefferens]|nr:hypothetical protein JL722_14354 [Aureococcus anophagefferens]